LRRPVFSSSGAQVIQQPLRRQLIFDGLAIRTYLRDGITSRLSGRRHCSCQCRLQTYRKSDDMLVVGAFARTNLSIHSRPRSDVVIDHHAPC
jgi:hypothetical protein